MRVLSADIHRIPAPIELRLSISPGLDKSKSAARGTWGSQASDGDATRAKSNANGSDERVTPFKHAIEKRTVWLYKRFCDEVRFHEWLDRDAP